jgi:hypothetical protein
VSPINDTFAINRNFKSAFLKTLIPQDETIAIPVKNFDAVATAVTKKKEATTEKLARETLFYKAAQTCKRLPHTGGISKKVNSNIRWNIQHGKISKTFFKVAVSKPQSKVISRVPCRSIIPLEVMGC